MKILALFLSSILIGSFTFTNAAFSEESEQKTPAQPPSVRALPSSEEMQKYIEAKRKAYEENQKMRKEDREKFLKERIDAAETLFEKNMQPPDWKPTALPADRPPAITGGESEEDFMLKREKTQLAQEIEKEKIKKLHDQKLEEWRKTREKKFEELKQEKMNLLEAPPEKSAQAFRDWEEHRKQTREALKKSRQEYIADQLKPEAKGN